MFSKSKYIIICFICGCTAVGPDYSEPIIDLPDRFLGSASSSLLAAPKAEWWKGLNDPILNDLIERGLTQNLDVSASVERIRAAELALGQVGYTAQASGDLSSSVNRSGLLDDRGVQQTETTTLNAQYVFDLFGGIRREIEQATANIGQAQANAGTVRLGYLTEITSAYVQARHFQNAAAITRRTIARQEETLELVRFRVELGDAAKLEEQQALERLNTFKANLPALQAGFETQVLRIATLLAEPAEPLLRQMQKGAPQPRPGIVGTLGVPADLIRNRPDIRSAEREYAAAIAAIGVAQARLYPSLSISGSISDSTLNTWSLGPRFSIPIFNRNVLSSRRDVAQSEARQAEIAWKSAIFGAVEDVQTALSQIRSTQKQVNAWQRVTNISLELVDLSKAAYEAGGIPLTDVLSAQLSLTNNELSFARAKLDHTIAWVELQVATGKGWSVE